MAEYIPILKRSGLYLLHIDGNGKRFASLFADTWRKLPLGVRRRLLKHWQESKPKIAPGTPESALGPLGFVWPHIELLADKSDFHWRGNSRDARAQVNLGGTHFAFKSRSMDRKSSGSVEETIAHELAHVYLGITEPEIHHAGIGTPLTYKSAPSEWDADKLAMAWLMDTRWTPRPEFVKQCAKQWPKAFGAERRPKPRKGR